MMQSNKELSNIIELHFIELAKYNNDISAKNQSRFDRWLHLLKFGELYASGERKLSDPMKEMEGITMVIDEIKVATSNAQLMDLIESRRKAEHDRATYLKEAKDQGLCEGITKGIKEGENKEKLKTAKKMLLKGLEFSLISEMTGLSLEDLGNIKVNS
jgi:predicted transposase/invertase (TIGR01784 family)